MELVKRSNHRVRLDSAPREELMMDVTTAAEVSGPLSPHCHLEMIMKWPSQSCCHSPCTHVCSASSCTFLFNSILEIKSFAS